MTPIEQRSDAAHGTARGVKILDYLHWAEHLYQVAKARHGEKSIKRVHAMKWRSDVTIKRKPLFVISALDTAAKFTAVVQAHKHVHFEPEYYLSCEIESEESEVLNGRNSYIVHYKGVAIKAATAFIDFEGYILKIEYIVDADFFDDDEFTEILKNIIFEGN